MTSVIAIAWLDPVRQIGWLIPLAGLFLLLAATQDIASDGLAVRILGLAERGVGNGIQVGGFYLGQIVGGGLTLALYAAYGWRMALMAMALFMALPLVNLAGFKEPAVAAKPAAKIGLGTLGRFLRRSGNGPWIVVLVLYRAGDAMALTMAKPLFVDLGLSLTDIGLIVGLGNSAAALIGAMIGGAAIERLGRRRALGGFAVLHGLALAGFVLPATGYSSLPTLWLVSALAAGAGGMATAALYTCMMDRSATATAGTDFTLQQSLAAAGPLAGAAFSGFSAEALGYPVHFVICALVSLAVALWVMTRVSLRQA